MRAILAMIAAVMFCAVAVRAADNVPTNYFAGYVYVSATNAGTVEAGMVTNTSYVCIPLATLTDLTAVQASASTGDVRAVVYGFAQAFYAAAAASTNASQTPIARTPSYAASGSNIIETVVHTIRSLRTIGTASFE